MTYKEPSLQDIQAAHSRIKPYIHKTPILTSKSLDQLSGVELFFKCENFQKVGAFKARGAMNGVLSLTKEELIRGVCTHSSGNHAQALALAARENGSNAFIVMPNNAPVVKKNAVVGYGAEVIECEPTLQARESTVETVMKEKGAVFIHPYNDYNIIAGQATAAKEVYETLEKIELDYILAPVGGGGLLSGTALATKYISASTKIIGCEPEGANDAYQSFQTKQLVPSENPMTIADGLLTSLGDKTFPIIINHVDDILTVSDIEIMEALKLTWERMKIIIEPSSAVCLAVVLKNKTLFKNKKVGIIISGGNVELSKIKF
ncbi:MAG: pyridoxal-phosphate dependent enzyme [Cyclobacteriaceae bacterium]|nr:pyridoxal-phosphate dependent enzyme [Cyclobacteriaceae bacterium]